MTGRSRNTRLRKNFTWVVSATLVLVAGFVFARTHGSAAGSASMQQRAVTAYNNQSLAFEPNQGQTDSQVKYMARGDRYMLFLTNREAVISVPAPSKHTRRGMWHTVAQETLSASSVVRMQILGASPQAHVAGSEQQPGVSNYYIGEDPHKWSDNVPHFAQVTYESAYPGINLAFTGNHQALDFQFAVAPNADSSLIHLRFDGAEKATLNQDGSLTLSAVSHPLQINKPVAYENVNGERKEVAANFMVGNDNTVSFTLRNYDRTHELQIGLSLAMGPAIRQTLPVANQYKNSKTHLIYLLWMPVIGLALAGAVIPQRRKVLASLVFCLALSGLGVLAACGGGSSGGGGGGGVGGATLNFGTYLGGSADDQGLAIAVDGSGNVYVVGQSASTGFPGSPGSPAGLHDAFVTKLSSAGAVQFSTFLGGTGEDAATAVTLQGGNIFIAGNTQHGATFAATNNIGPLGGQDAFVAEFSSTGSLVTSTTFGGTANETALGIAIDGSGNVYVAGQTGSSNFPTANPFQASFGGGTDAFITKLNSSLGTLGYSTYLGGSGGDLATGVALDGSGNAYVSGVADSAGLQTTGNNLSGPEDGFVAEFSSTGAETYFVYVGGSGDDSANAIAVDPASGTAYVTGFTQSADFPHPGTPFQGALSGSQDAFVTQVNAGGAIGFSTFLGGSGSADDGLAIAIDASKNVYITGNTDSNNFPLKTAITGGTALNGSNDAFVTEISSSGSSDVFSTYYGGAGSEDSALNGVPGGGIAVDSAGVVYVTGTTNSTSGLPLANAAQGTFGGGTGDAFVCKITP